ncbi:DUF2147 domain-containing protein [Brachyspira murdochii]|uniref:DUF2147 domain-containing protein n=1 Tax=Brachyspira murdochii (strain ATCC 51284 / DSM 12563 / 56-150) TaxID=526224 RepID=D5U7W2_BRAM5|nr:DUF2147 domain-containing protein [Brachyspira murdochii]ADG72908.1 Protein of unknown function DUF2147 [Brachyspira murdochii DSM 12563]
MKKNILLIIFTLLFASSVYAANNAKDAEGFWAMPEKPKGRMKTVKIIVIDNKVYAYAVELRDNIKSTLDIHNPNKSLRDKELIGLIFIYDIVFENGQWTTGRIYHTDQGSTYYANINLTEDKNTLLLKASLDKSGMVGATVKWRRLSKEESSKYNDIPINKLRTVEGKGI